MHPLIILRDKCFGSNYIKNKILLKNPDKHPFVLCITDKSMVNFTIRFFLELFEVNGTPCVIDCHRNIHYDEDVIHWLKKHDYEISTSPSHPFFTTSIKSIYTPPPI